MRFKVDMVTAFYGGIVLFALFYGVIAFAQPAGLQGPFVPIKATPCGWDSPEQCVDVEAVSYTDGGLPLYIADRLYTPASDMLSLCSQATSYVSGLDDLNVATLNDRWPANIDTSGCDVQQDFPEFYANDGNCFEAVSDFISPGSSVIESLIECQDRVKAYVDSQNPMTYPDIEYNGFTCANEGTSFSLNRARISFNVTGFFVSTVARFDVEGEYFCADVDDPIPDEDDPSDVEIMDELAPNVTAPWWVTSQNRITQSNTTIQNWVTNETNNYNTYVQNWMTGDPLLPSNVSPVPPSLPSPTGTPSSTASFDCSATPDILACATYELEEVELPDTVSGVAAIFEPLRKAYQ